MARTRNNRNKSGKGSNQNSGLASLFALNSQLLQDSASFSYNTPLGSKLSGVQSGNTKATTYIPGVMAIAVKTTPGLAVDGSAPINTASNNIYSFVRHANSGHSNYDAPDLMLYLLGVGELLRYHAHLVRMYGILNTYSQVNRYLPVAVFDAMGVDFYDLQKNMADFHYFINAFAVKIGSLCVPASMPYYRWQIEMMSHVYQDQPSEKSQLFIHVPDCFYKYNPTATKKGGSLDPIAFSTFSRVIPSNRDKYLKYADLVSLGLDLVNQIVPDEDMNIMSGDIRKAFGADGLWKTFQISAEYSLLPEYDPNVLNMINNTTPIRCYATTDAPLPSWSIFSDVEKNAVVFDPDPNPAGSDILPRYLSGRYPVNMPWDAVTPANTMLGTQMTVRAAAPATEWSNLFFTSLPAILCTDIWLVRGSASFPTVPANAALVPGILLPDDSATDSSAQAIIAAYSSNFNQAPTLIIGSSQQSDGDILFEAFVGDMQNYTMVDGFELAKMHETALLSLLNVPQLGFTTLTR